MSFYLSNIRSINKNILLKVKVKSNIFINQKKKFIPSYFISTFNINKSLIINRNFSSLADTPISDSNNDTIYALSSATNTKAGVAVIRLSGPQSKECLKYFLKPNTKFPLPRQASLRKLYCPETKDILDSALVLWFPDPNSFTGEDVVELHIHGSRAVILGVFNALDNLNNNRLRVRPAERGEFTRRAFDNGQMDLTEVEGLADLLSAETSEQRKQALRQMEGYLRISFENWR
jgi:tRNA modification GTPase